jgi:ABC-type branched-subunit amino acid transport system substrate-binding protein
MFPLRSSGSNGSFRGLLHGRALRRLRGRHVGLHPARRPEVDDEQTDRHGGSLAGRANERLPAAGSAFVRAFAATQSNRRIASYAAAYSAQAAEVLLAAIARSDGTRDSVRELFATRVRGGILEDFSFTSVGDMTPSPVTIFRVVGGKGSNSTFLKDFDGSVVDRVVDVPASLAR